LSSLERDAVKIFRLSCLFLLVCLVTPSRLGSDAIVITKAMTASTIAQLFVEQDSVRVVLEIGVQDLEGFRDLLPDALYQRLGHDPEPLKTRLSRFFREDFVIRADDGAPLPGWVEDMEGRRRVPRDEVTGQPLPVEDDEGEPVVFAKLVYPLRGEPKVVHIRPPRDENGTTNANIGFVVFHRSLPVNDFRYLGTEETLRLDWEDPWYSKFDNRNLWRQYDSPISAFLYVEPYEVRKEIVLRPKDLEPWLDLGLEGKEIITVEEQEEVKKKVVDFLAERNPVTIDGQSVDGTLDRVHFIYRNLRTSGVIDPARDLDVISATLGVIFYYPVDGLPEDVTMEWELFSDRIQAIPSSATDEAGPLPYKLLPNDSVLRWQNFLKNPTIPGLVEVQAPPRGLRLWFLLLVLFCGGGLAWMVKRHGKSALAGQWPSRKILAAAGALVVVGALALPRALNASYVSEEDAKNIVTGLLENIYRSFDYRQEGVIYDSLEKSAAGDLLTNIYLETRRSLELENQGGARAKVKEVQMLESSHEPLGGEKGFVSRCTWNVSGSVGHWGHIHQRTNQYQARFVVKEVDGAWKITDLELLQEERL
jgi:hypothetical protein